MHISSFCIISDDSKFGQKMLEKMGWKHGQGIGLNNQGITENIKVRLKLDSKGELIDRF